MIVNIAAYHFVAVDAPRALADAFRQRCETLALRGSVLVAGEGINLFLAGAAEAIDDLLAWLQADARFAGMPVKRSVSRTLPFRRLKVKVKREIIAFRRDEASPLQRRAPGVSPEDLARWLDQGHDDAGRHIVLLDTRNREEFGYGTFEGAHTPAIDNFVDLPAAIAPLREQWKDATIVPFCTGGIRCEKAALWMQHAGFGNVLQLEGGILGYFERMGGRHYAGRCFVFDERVALDARLQPLVDSDSDSGTDPSLPRFA